MSTADERDHQRHLAEAYDLIATLDQGQRSRQEQDEMRAAIWWEVEARAEAINQGRRVGPGVREQAQPCGEE